MSRPKEWLPPLYDRPWRDGGYDRDEVELCPHHPDHDWQQFKVSELRGNTNHPEDTMTVCATCRVPRCGESEPDGCDLPRHHKEAHRTKQGAGWPVGGTRVYAQENPAPDKEGKDG